MFNIKRALIFFSLMNILIFSSACSSLMQKWKSLVSGEPERPQTTRSASANPNEPQTPSFSNQPNIMVGKERRYHRVTKDNFSEEQGLEGSVGSLWRKEGQGSYLFSQNNLRVLGDIVKVSVEGKTAENLDTKLSIIKQTLARLEAPPLKPGQRQPASKQAANAKGSQAASNTQQLDQNANQNSNGENAQTAQNNDKDKSKFEPVPCRIVEKNSDGSYRVKGQQTVYVGKHEYRLVVTGILHADDISDGSITSGKLLDSKFDLVASNKDVKNDLLR